MKSSNTVVVVVVVVVVGFFLQLCSFFIDCITYINFKKGQNKTAI